MDKSEVERMLDLLEEQNEDISDALIDYIHIDKDYGKAAKYIMKLTKCSRDIADEIVANCVSEDNTIPQPTPQPNIPKCPICGSTDLSKITTTQKAGKAVLFGLFASGDMSKTWKCNKCGSKF